MLMRAALPPCRDVTVALPLALRHLADSTTIRVSGNSARPLVVAIGGISADRFVCTRGDGGAGWWPGLVGPGAAVDPHRHLVLGLDFAADEEGRSAPTTREQALVLCAALDAIGAERADVVLGASYGGMVALALAERWPERVGRIAVISAPAEPHSASTAVRELQRRTVALGRDHGCAEEALALARGLAMVTYRTPEEFAARFAGGLREADPLAPSEPGAYLRARGKAYQAVMSPGRFLSLSASIDRHRVDPGAIRCAVLLIGADSDRIVPASQIEALAAGLADCRLHLLDCLYGHDMFLKEAARLSPLLGSFIEQTA